MLISWSLSNFKSVTEQITLKLSPLTLFTGANSAGKSTIIQSMLLTAQTIQSSVLSRPVVLNGHMARLGSYTDLVSSGDVKKNISIGFEIRTDLQEAPGQRSWALVFGRHRGMVQKVSINYSFSVIPGPNEILDKDLLNLQPSLVETDISVDYVVEGKNESDQVVIRRSAESIGARVLKLKLESAGLQESGLSSLRYVISKAPKSRGFRGGLEGVRFYTEFAGAYMQHFLPRSFSAKFDEVDAEIEWQISILTEPDSFRRRSTRPDLLEKALPDKVFAIVLNVLVSIFAVRNDFPSRPDREDLFVRFKNQRNLNCFIAIMRQLLTQEKSNIYSLLASEKGRIETFLRENRPARYNLEIEFPNDHINYGVEYTQNFFSASVKYLGPLRDEPKPVYPLAGATDPGDVGFRGEHTAAVLDIHKNTFIEYIPSNQFSEEWVTLTPSRRLLAVAVQDWLEYMGVGRDFVTIDLGKLGHELRVTTSGSDLQHDLTQVGVGVSQVLPILVLALIADAGSTLIFEQPELHLHPRVQSRLADFFVSMNRLGKQCIVETHSEYIINRLRLRAASEVGSEVSSNTIIYFVEKDQGRSIYRPVAIDALGGLDNWPAGFFDESDMATTALLRQSLKKRKKDNK